MLQGGLRRDESAADVNVDHAVHLSSVDSSNGFGIAVPALLTSTSSRPKPYTKGADAAAAVVQDIERSGGKAIAIQADAAAETVKAAVEKTVETAVERGIGTGRTFE